MFPSKPIPERRSPHPVVGKTYLPRVYAVGREKIAEYATSIGETNPIHLRAAAAQAAGYPDVVAPPMFCAVYSRAALQEVLFDPELELDYARVVHGRQEFVWSELVIAGDEISTVFDVKSIDSKGTLMFYVLGSTSRNQYGNVVCRGLWTEIVRGKDG